MTSPYPAGQPKRLERSKSNRIIGGVCAGLANYLNMDPTLVRVLTVLLTLFTGVPVVLYLVMLFVVPEEGTATPPPSYPPVDQAGTTQQGTDPVWGPTGAPWEQQPASQQPAPAPAPPPAAEPKPTDQEPGPTDQEPGRQA
jgi:phage shock protein PspC (stress-responsive transcriptional regulator)